MNPVRRLAAALRSGVPPEEREAVAAALGQLTARRTLRLGRATYTDLLSTGNLRLIRNADLRDRIVRLYEANERVQLIRDRNNQEFVDRMYVTYLLDQGLVAPPPDRKLAAVAASDASSGAIDQSRQMIVEITTVQRAIAAELSTRRWP